MTTERELGELLEALKSSELTVGELEATLDRAAMSPSEVEASLNRAAVTEQELIDALGDETSVAAMVKVLDGAAGCSVHLRKLLAGEKTAGCPDCAVKLAFLQTAWPALERAYRK